MHYLKTNLNSLNENIIKINLTYQCGARRL